MGWSCTKEAGDVMNKIFKKSFNQSGIQGAYTYKGHWYNFDPDNIEHEDGSITGQIDKFIDFNPKSERMSARKVGTFKIDPHGRIIRGIGLKELLRT